MSYRAQPPASFTSFVAELKQKAREETGLVECKTVPHCPECKRPLFCFYGRNSKEYLVIHSTYPCERRFDTFAKAKTEYEAWTLCA